MKKKTEDHEKKKEKSCLDTALKGVAVLRSNGTVLRRTREPEESLMLATEGHTCPTDRSFNGDI